MSSSERGIHSSSTDRHVYGCTRVPTRLSACANIRSRSHLWSQALGMTKPPSVRRAFLHHVLRTTEEHGEGQLRFAEGDKVLGDPHWPMVRQLTLLDTLSLLKRYVSKVNLSTHALPKLDLGERWLHMQGCEPSLREGMGGCHEMRSNSAACVCACLCICQPSRRSAHCECGQPHTHTLILGACRH